MAQHDFNIANQGFPAFRTDLNDALSAINSFQSGTSRPASAVAGTMWLDTTNATNPTIKFFDGTDDITFATVDYSANTINFSDSASDILGDTTPQLGGMLDVNGQAIGDGTLELIKFLETASAVNEITITNADTTNAPEISATGDDTNIDLKLTPKGSGNLVLDGIKFPNADGTANQVLQTDGSGNLSFANTSGGIAWQSVQTTGFTASAGNGYPCDTTSAGFTVTLPATPSAGDQVQLVDYAGTWDTNNLTIDPNGEDILGQASNVVASKDREAITLTYIDSTQGWIPSSGYQESTQGLGIPYSIDFLVIAGGGSGAEGNGAGGGGGAGGYRTSTQSTLTGIVITVTVGDGGADQAGVGVVGNSGSSSSISGSGLTTITSAGGGGGGNYSGNAGVNGGSGGGGGGGGAGGTGGTGNTPSTSPSQGNDGGVGWSGGSNFGAGGGGGAGATGSVGTSAGGGNGGTGTASSITGSSVTYAGGGGGGTENGTKGTGGSGGGGNGGQLNVYAIAGTVNTGGGGGGGGYPDPYRTGKAGGKGVVILSMPLARFSGTTTGSPTESTSGSNKILVFTGSGSYTS
jgi:hypothetical protein